MANLLKRYFTRKNQQLGGNTSNGSIISGASAQTSDQNTNSPTDNNQQLPVNDQNQQTPQAGMTNTSTDANGQTNTNQVSVNQPPEAPVADPNQAPSGINGAANVLASGSNVSFGPSTMDPATRSSLSVISKLTQRSNQVILKAAESATKNKVQFIEPEHLLYGAIFDPQVFQLVQNLGGNAANIQKEVEAVLPKGNFNGQSQFGPQVKQILELSLVVAKEQKVEYISPEHIMVALIRTPNTKAQTILQKNNVNEQTMKQLEETGAVRSHESALDKYGVDLTKQARDGKLDPITGRSAEIERSIHILSRRTKNNPVLIGEAGVGKTAIVEGLAQKIVKKEVPESLTNKRIIALDLTSLVAGAAHRGEFEERMRAVMTEVKVSAGEIILFIDEVHNLVGAGGGEGTMQAANILKPSLSRGELQMIGTTTIDEYRKYIEKDAALERRFQPIMVNEPSDDVAIEMLKILRPKYEEFHKVKIEDEAIEAAVKLSNRYVGDRFLPDKAVDLIDEGASSVRLPAIYLPEQIQVFTNRLTKVEADLAAAEKAQDSVRAAILKRDQEETKKQIEDLQKQLEVKQKSNNSVVTKSDVERIVSSWTGIPVARLTENESAKLLNMENLIHERLIDQEAAVTAVAEAIRRGRAGLGSNKRPIGSFLFLGPTGVGKTELSKTLAEILFGKEESLIRLDMSEYMEKHEVAKLIGAPPGYVGYEEGGQLTEAVRRKPYSVVLLDEVEKANPDVFNILLQVLEDGRLTDNKGRTISFKNTIIIATSNIGTKLIQENDVKAFSKQTLGANSAVPSSVSTAKPEDSAKKPVEGEEANNQDKPYQPQNTQVSDAQKERENVNRSLINPEAKNDAFTMLAAKLMGELKKFFAPELLNRFDEIVIFKPLLKEDMKKIVGIQLKNLTKLLEEQNLSIEVTNAAQDHLAVVGFDPVFGARPLRRLIQMEVENPISSLIIKGEYKPGDTVLVDFVEGAFKFGKKEVKPQPPVANDVKKDPEHANTDSDNKAIQPVVSEPKSSAPTQTPPAGQISSSEGSQPVTNQEPITSTDTSTTPAVVNPNTPAPDPIQNLQNMYGANAAPNPSTPPISGGQGTQMAPTEADVDLT